MTIEICGDDPFVLAIWKKDLAVAGSGRRFKAAMPDWRAGSIENLI